MSDMCPEHRHQSDSEVLHSTGPRDKQHPQKRWRFCNYGVALHVKH